MFIPLPEAAGLVVRGGVVTVVDAGPILTP
jgi:hypothetical protein